MLNVNCQLHIDILKDLEKQCVNAARKALRDIAVSAYNQWQDEAGRHFNRTRAVYRSAIKMQKINPDEFEVFLHHDDGFSNWLAVALELGWEGGPQYKEGLLNSYGAYNWSQFAKKATRGTKAPGGTKSGPGVPFIDVPFRTRTWSAGERERAGLGPLKKRQKTQGKPDMFRRLSGRNIQNWKDHPGFKPRGLRELVKDHIEEQAQGILSQTLGEML